MLAYLILHPSRTFYNRNMNYRLLLSVLLYVPLLPECLLFHAGILFTDFLVRCTLMSPGSSAMYLIAQMLGGGVWYSGAHGTISLWSTYKCPANHADGVSYMMEQRAPLAIFSHKTA
ncbi:hypothetical protein AcW1_010205 [Taiwanofungus camphoratus]|nr:hypothetical protein AcV5_003094 [Antrodia cinnamomea]KAI0946873.1 hypothetical protein AcW1_010205 [Antrodia cinnamomea]KAI0954378.1 hypothetical protein AcV7_007630 [Antrodia cinnamomea]